MVWGPLDAAAGPSQLDFQRRQIHTETARGGDRDRMHGKKGRSRGDIHSRQWGGLRHEVLHQAVRCFSTASSAGGLRRHRHRSGYSSTHHTSPWRPRLGGGQSGWRRHLLLFTYQEQAELTSTL